jgi:hypothetical protein
LFARGMAEGGLYYGIPYELMKFCCTNPITRRRQGE